MTFSCSSRLIISMFVTLQMPESLANSNLKNKSNFKIIIKLTLLPKSEAGNVTFCEVSEITQNFFLCAFFTQCHFIKQPKKFIKLQNFKMSIDRVGNPSMLPGSTSTSSHRVISQTQSYLQFKPADQECHLRRLASSSQNGVEHY